MALGGRGWAGTGRVGQAFGMLLAADVGNTQTLIGLFGGDDGVAGDVGPVVGRSRCEEGLLDHWRIHTNGRRTSDEYALQIQEFLGFHGFSFDDDVDGIAISSVVPSVTAALREMTVITSCSRA